MQTGLVEVILGSMFSGKTTELLRRVRRSEIAGQKVLVFKPHIDNRYSLFEAVSHDRTSFTCVPVRDATKILGICEDEKPEVVAIDEAQFLTDDLSEVVDELARRGHRVLIAGLDTDFMGNPWPTMTRIAFRADKLKKLNAVCVKCGEDACRNQRLIDGVAVTHGDVVEVGGAEAYEARCRSCFEEESGTLDVDSNELRREANL